MLTETAKITHKCQKEYRLYKFYDHLCPQPEIITLGTKKGIYEEILPEYIKEILLEPSCDVNTETALRLELNKMFPNGEYDHIEITRSKRYCCMHSTYVER